MIKKIFIFTISFYIFIWQCNIAVFAADIEDELSAQVFKEQNLENPIYTQEIIQDECIKNLNDKSDKPIISQEFLNDELLSNGLNEKQLQKPTVNNTIIIDYIPDKESNNQNLMKFDGKYKFIDENDQTVYIPISSINLLATQKGLFEGKKVNFIVISDVMKNGEVFIKKDTPVEAFVETITKSSFAGDPAELIIGRFTSKDINGNKICITGEIDKKGANRALWVKPLMYAGYCVPIFGTPLLLLYFVKGGKAKIKPKCKFKLYLE